MRIAGRRHTTVDELLRKVNTKAKTTKIRLLDAVALTADFSDRRSLAGQVGTAVEMLDDGVFEVEFCDDQGRTYATLSLQGDQLMPLHYVPVPA